MGADSKHVLIVANETIGGRKLMEAIGTRAKQGAIRCTVICPANEPPFGFVIYDDSSRSAAQIRLALTLEYLRKLDIQGSGEIGDADAYLAAQDAVRFYEPDEIIISTNPYPRSGFFRRDLVERIATWSGLPVTHVVIDLNDEPVKHAIVVANQTVTAGPLLDALERRANESPYRFTVICPVGGDGAKQEIDAAKDRVGRTVSDLRRAGLEVVGQVMDHDPLTAIQNAVKYHPADEVIVSTLSVDESKWLDSGLINKAAKATGLPVAHVVGVTEPQGAAA